MAAGTSSSSSTSNGNSSMSAVAREQGSSEQLMPIGSPVRHLPPLTLHLVFPVTYPSQEPPDVRVTGSWLGPQQQQQLAAALLASWEEEAPGAPVCYQWLEWLRSNALQHLGMAGSLVIPVSLQDVEEQAAAEPGSSPEAAGPSSPPAAAAAAAAAGGGAPQELLAAYMARCEQVALQVLSHDRAQEQAAFEASNWPCAICLDKVPGSKCIQVAPCHHVFCRACLASYCDSLVGEGAVQQLRCPDPSCRSSLLPDQVRQLLTPEQFTR
jgi:E3 ubiquitin-protein ligase RNF14